jgi:colanic acid biosynthesis glycosyl transferase WcaI
MRLLFLSINYAPEPTGFAPHVTDACTYLAAKGHAVEIVTGFPFAPMWKRWPEYRGRFFASAEQRGVRVHRVTHYIPRQASRVIERLLMEATFSLVAAIFLVLRCERRFDAIVYVGAQPAIAMLACVTARFLRRPYVVNIQDLASLAAGDTRIVRNRLFLRLLSRFEWKAYAGATGAMVLCESFRQALQDRGFPGQRIRLIRSPIDTERVRPVGRETNIRASIGIEQDAFVILHSGSMGVKQGLANVIRAAALLRDSAPEARWVFIGDGETRSEIVQLAKQLGMEGIVIFRPFFPEEDIARLFAAADILLLNQIKEVKDTVIPSKLLTYMAAGKAVLAAVNDCSQGAALLRNAGGGEVVEPENPESLADAVRRLMKDRNTLPVLGARNRAYAETNFDRRHILIEQERFLEEVVRSWQSRAV